MQVKKVKISEIKTNPKNPRLIKDDKFKKLVKSIQDFPKMLELRPIVVDENNIVLGGNMRLKACIEVGLKEIYIVQAADLTEKQKDEFIVKDNVGFGEWDWDVLANEWQDEDLNTWGLEMSFLNSLEYETPESMEPENTSDFIPNEEQKIHNLLSDRFIVPPFSIFDTKQGYWQTRKHEWKSLGIQSEVGRGGNLLKYSDTILQAANPLKKFNKLVRASSPNTSTIETKIPNYYGKKESGLTDVEIIKDFIENSQLGGTSVFDPVLCEIAYKWFCKENGTVLDPFAGGSVRGIVASKVGRQYIGIDLRQEQVQANEEQVLTICENNHPKYIVGSSENVVEMIGALKETPEIDMIFTCPPYYDLEQYSENPQDLSTLNHDEFDNIYEDIIIKSVSLLSENSFSVFVVGDVRDKNGVYLDLIGKTVAAHKKAGAVYYNSAVLLESVGTASMRAARIFNGGRKLCKVHQNVLVFYKGDISKIKDKFKEIEIETETNDPGVATEYGERLSIEVEI
jgi:16S rRNA G966 N2-methylase RsmD